ncbi:diphosphomevalonate decarboxylase [Streptomyces sp. NBC_01264]|uniref:diphosphomevalonate decarboxylase n=1 Tax=Streptomyces sp. NBC_01264 TaxID=2903804 RepID=UPI0022547B91|nr:diphosphomevalonate decarboxylase [Streptomyces sp. NBC_01264]MCX4784542.1 diphosphomevalonate decarboxylase [Streptomyces sp. NBC_01264]
MRSQSTLGSGGIRHASRRAVTWATASSNLALVKYWGKGASGHDAAGASLSVTLDGLSSFAGVQRHQGPGSGASGSCRWSPPGPTDGLARFVSHARRQLGISDALDVVITSNFPVAAGLASSASAYAALTTALGSMVHPAPGGAELAELARAGSGSACRSLLGGFVLWRPGERESVAQVAPAEHWPLEVVIAITREGVKHTSSRDGMLRTASTSPFYKAWLAAGAQDLSEVIAGVLGKDLKSIGLAVERNALRMHASALGADPPLLYWEPATVAVIREVWHLRAGGLMAFFSIDAGPQVKILCEPGSGDAVAAAVAAVPGVSRVLRSRPGGAPRVLSQPPSWAESAFTPPRPTQAPLTGQDHG